MARVSDDPAAAHPVARLYRRPGGVWSDAVPPYPTGEIDAGYAAL